VLAWGILLLPPGPACFAQEVATELHYARASRDCHCKCDCPPSPYLPLPPPTFLPRTHTTSAPQPTPTHTLTVGAPWVHSPPPHSHTHTHSPPSITINPPLRSTLNNTCKHATTACLNSSSTICNDSTIQQLPPPQPLPASSSTNGGCMPSTPVMVTGGSWLISRKSQLL